MKTKKMLSLSLLTLAICSVALAAEYKSPEVGFKERAAPSKEMKTADFGDHYRVEGAVVTDRQIASEVEEQPSDREPSSMKAKAKKKMVKEEVVPEKAPEEFVAPKPWLFKQDYGNQH